MITVVTGAPAAGKTTHIMNHMSTGDIILGVDDMRGVLLGSQLDAPQGDIEHARDVAYTMWRAAVNHVIGLAKQGDLDYNVWIEHGNPSVQDKTRYRSVGARLVTVDPGRRVVMQRLADSGGGTPDRVQAVADWYATTRPTRRGRAKGRGTEHDKQRAKLKRQHVDGSPCWWCGKPMYLDKSRNHDNMPLAADHVTSVKHGGRLAGRLLHFTCNSSRQEGDRDHLRPALKNDDKSPGVFNWG